MEVKRGGASYSPDDYKGGLASVAQGATTLNFRIRKLLYSLNLSNI